MFLHQLGETIFIRVSFERHTKWGGCNYTISKQQLLSWSPSTFDRQPATPPMKYFRFTSCHSANEVFSVDSILETEIINQSLKHLPKKIFKYKKHKHKKSGWNNPFNCIQGQITHTLFSNVGRPTSSTGPHLDRYDVRVAHI